MSELSINLERIQQLQDTFNKSSEKGFSDAPRIWQCWEVSGRNFVRFYGMLPGPDRVRLEKWAVKTLGLPEKPRVPDSGPKPHILPKDATQEGKRTAEIPKRKMRVYK